MNMLTPDQVRDMSVSTLAGFSAEVLCQLQTSAAERLKAEKHLVDLIDQALDHKFAEKARALRLTEGKDTGIVHFDDGRIRISADLPKKTEWNQSLLADMARRIAAAGDDPSQYIEVSYRISETKYLAWPDNFRNQFQPARTVKTGKATYRLTSIQEQ
jgi:hypothetical protein